MKYGCIGERLAHSFSKEIHNMLADYEYELCEVARDDFDGFMKKRDFCAVNVTIPYKEAVIPYLDYISERARSIGAVNTVVKRNGQLYGYNTDFLGMRAMIEKNGIEIKDKKVLVLGTGGTSRTACAVAKDLGAREIVRVSRTPSGEGEISYAEAYDVHADAQIIINTTPCGMYPKVHASPIDVKLPNFKALEGVVDAVYNPLKSELVSDALSRGVKAVGGLYMLVAQAVFAVEKFMDTEIDGSVIDRVYGEILKRKLNVVLVGMPACGKSTVGKILAEKLGKEFYDTDEMIISREGMAIKDIFEKFGEPHFRRIESDVVQNLAALYTSSVISTGGGAVLDVENIQSLKQNGKVYFLDRPLEMLICTADRPLSSNADMLRKRYEERYEIYKSCADVIIDASVSVDEVVNAILQDIEREDI
jgi:shikimate dehydrogenase